MILLARLAMRLKGANGVALGLSMVLSFAVIAIAGEDETRPRQIGGLTFADDVEVTIVDVIAHVTDQQGNAVTDLTQSDFRIFQDGQERQISNFQLYTEGVLDRIAVDPSRIPPEKPDSEGAIEPWALNMVLYVDNENLHPLDRNRLLRDVVGFVSETLRPPVQMMVVSFQKDLTILQPFTSERRPILEALRGVRTHSGGRPQRDSARQDILDRMNREIERQGQSSGYGAPSSQTYGDILAFADEEAHNLTTSIDALREVVTLLAGLPGRKSILYISNGLPMIPGFELFNTYADTTRDPTILTEVQRYDRSSIFRSLVETANSQGVSIYTVGAGGLEVAGMSRGEHRASRAPVVSTPRADSYLDGLQFMADGTGGLAILRTNEFASGLKQIQKDVFTYYSLGYRLIPSGRDKVHRIEVTIPGRPDLVVRYRSRAVERSLETRIRERVLAGLHFDLDENPMDLVVNVGVATLATADRWTVPIHVSLPVGKVALLPEGEDYVGRVVLIFAALDADGKASDAVRQEHEIRIPAGDYERVLESRLGIDANLLMLDGSYRIAVGVMDQVASQASYSTTNVTVPSP